MKKFITITLCILLAVILLLGCKKEEAQMVKPKGGTIKVIMPWGRLTFSINPFMNAGNRLAITSIIHESLIFISWKGKEYPLLATSYKWKNNNLDLVFTLRKGVKWSDGKLFTSADVVFTFNLFKKHKSCDQHGIWESVKGLKSVNARGKYEVTFSFSVVNTPLLRSLTQVLIVPEHIWSKVEYPSNYTNENPIGTGAFMFKSFSEKNNIMHGVRNPNYWDKTKPYADNIEIHSVKDNNISLLSMLKGQADWSYTFIPNIKEAWADKNPENNKYWKPAVNSVILFLNNEKPPLDNIKFRKAISTALNRELMSEKIYQGIGAAHPTGIPPNIQDEWLDEELKNKTYIYNPQKAQELLTEIGYTKKNGVLVGLNGQKVRNFKILVGAGWTDYIGLAQIISKNLKELGISLTIDQKQWGDYYTSFQTGTYDTGIISGQGLGPSPYYIFIRHFTEIKTIGNTNFSRYIKKDILAALNTYRKTIDPKVLKKSMNIISNLIIEEVPYIPLTNATSHHVFSEARFIGWPSDSNPYADGAPDTQAGAIILSNVYLK
ncbi:MAG: ABC transporter substrate-binding protein [Spirochaetes bacterium]|nr:ABC transporter substrate-binding protein [Spirochaetota bacterium]